MLPSIDSVAVSDMLAPRRYTHLLRCVKGRRAMASVESVPAGGSGMAGMFMGQAPPRKARKEGDVSGLGLGVG